MYMHTYAGAVPRGGGGPGGLGAGFDPNPNSEQHLDEPQHRKP